MSRFKAIGHFVYENGDRIGVTLDEAAVELARKLNAYQMRVERFKEQDRSQTESHRINTSMWKDEVARLKTEVERLTAFTTRTIIPNEELQAQVERVGAENAHLHKGIYSLSLNVAQLKDEVERLTKAGDAFVLLLEDEGYDLESIREVEAWNAAKEGKQP
jgi:HAMP domain-containing protein